MSSSNVAPITVSKQLTNLMQKEGPVKIGCYKGLCVVGQFDASTTTQFVGDFDKAINLFKDWTKRGCTAVDIDDMDGSFKRRLKLVNNEIKCVSGETCYLNVNQCSIHNHPCSVFKIPSDNSDFDNEIHSRIEISQDLSTNVLFSNVFTQRKPRSEPLTGTQSPSVTATSTASISA